MPGHVTILAFDPNLSSIPPDFEAIEVRLQDTLTSMVQLGITIDRQAVHEMRASALVHQEIHRRSAGFGPDTKTKVVERLYCPTLWEHLDQEGPLSE